MTLLSTHACTIEDVGINQVTGEKEWFQPVFDTLGVLCRAVCGGAAILERKKKYASAIHYYDWMLEYTKVGYKLNSSLFECSLMQFPTHSKI